MVKNLKRTLALMLSIIMIMSSTLMTYAEDGGFIASSEAETSAQVEETVAAEAETSTKTPEAEASTQQTQAAPAAEAVEAVKPEITGQPEDAAVRLNDEAVFSLETNGQVKSCQWQTAKTKGGVWSNLNRREYGSSETLKIRAVKKYDKRFFRCIVTFKDGTTAKSDEARLSIVENESFPAQNFGSVKDTKVVAPEGAFPAGTTMEADEVEDTAAVQAIIDDMDDVDGSVLNAVDISFYNGGEIQPKEAVKVTMNVGKDVDFDKLVLVHINADADQLQDDNLKTETVDFTYDKEAGTITFNADSFSTYTLIDTVVILDSEGSFNFETKDYNVTVSYTKDAKIPVGTKLTVSQIEDDSDEYWDLRNKTLEKINENATWGSELEPDTRKGIAAAAFFDISLINNDKEIEPEAPLQVEIELKNGGLPRFDGEDTKVIHFADKGTEIIEGSELNIKASDKQMPEGMPEGEIVNAFEFMQNSFSVDGVFTTDEYIEGGILESEFTAPVLRAAGDVINADKSVTDRDNDGIYDLELYVQGDSKKEESEEVEKSNVVIVIDKSNSMTNNYTYAEYTYSSTTYNNSSYYTDATSGNNIHRVYHDDQGWYYTTGSGTWWDPTERHNLGINAKVYLRRTRMEATKEAASELVGALLDNNDSSKEGYDDIVEISLVTFSGPNSTNADGTVNDAQVLVGYNSANTTNETVLKSQINDIDTVGGTNWEAALRTALSQANSFKTQEPKEQVSIIFLTDGMPTFWVGGGNGTESSTSNVQNSWTNARDEAYAIATTNKHTLYNIFAFGTPNGAGSNYLKALTNYAYGRGGSYNDTADTTYTNNYFFDAQDTSALQAAFEAIVHNISNSVGYAGVAVTDGVNLGATNTSATVGGTVHPQEFTYTVYDGTRIVYSVKFDDAGNNATFTINGQDYTSTCETVTTEIKNAEGQVVKTISSKVAKVTVNDVEYKMSPATLDSAGLIEWELAGLGVLPNYKFVLSMHVWPNQMSYDIVADMNNQIYSDLDTAIAHYGITDQDEIAKIKASIEQESDGSYSVYTNYEQSVRYYEADEETVDGETTTTYGAEQNKPLTHPDPIPLVGSKIPMEKKWGSDLAITELQELVFGKNGVYNGYKVVLDLKKDGVLYKSYEFPKLNSEGKPVDANGNVSTDVTKLVWRQDAAISPGRLVTKDPGGKTYKKINLTGTTINGVDISGEYYVIEDGHKYEIEEKEGSDLHFEFSTDTYHPMIVDGQLMNVKVTLDSDGKIVEGSSAEVIDPDMTSIFATNTLKGGLNIRKIVTGEDKTTPITGVKDEFTFEITLTKDGQPYGTPSDQYSTTKPEGYDEDPDHNGWSYDSNHEFYYKSGFSAFNIYSGDKNDSGERVRIDRSWIPADGKLTLTMPADGEIRVVNLPTGTQYTVKEIIGDSGEYEYLKTVSSIKYGEDEDGKDLIEDEPAPVTTTDNTVSGTVVGNKANLEEYYNWAASFYVYHSKDNKIEKISFADSRVNGTYDAATKKYTYEFDIVRETKSDCLYGGYFTAYSKAGMTNADIVQATYTSGSSGSYTYWTDHPATGNWVTDEGTGVAPYTGATVSFKNANVCTENGMTMSPVRGSVYYLKEIPNQYFRPSTYVVWDTVSPNKDIRKLYMMSVADDSLYKKVGFDGTIGLDPTTKLYSSFKVTLADGSEVFVKPTGTESATVSVVNSVLPRGFLTVWDANSKINPPGFDATPFIVTKDNVKVTGVIKRTITIADGLSYNDFAYTDDRVTSTYSKYVETTNE